MKNCKSRLCSGPFTHVNHYWWKRSFRVFGMGFDRPSARLETTKKRPLYPGRHILSQHPHSQPLERIAWGHKGRQTANIAKMAEKCINCTSARRSPPHANHMESGPKNTFSAQNKRNKKIHHFRPKKRGGHFLDIFDPPTTTSLKSPKKWVSRGGFWGGPDQKLFGDVFFGQKNFFTRG